MSAFMKNAKVELHWSDRQCSLMVEALVRKPFVEVFELVGKFNQKMAVNSSGMRSLEFDYHELKICLEALRNSKGMEFWEFALEIRDQLKSCGILGEDCD